MNVLYVSKALVVAAYRQKLSALARHVKVEAVTPAQWGERSPEPGENGGPPLHRQAAFLHGHNHLHLYRRAGSLLQGRSPDLVHVDEEPYSAVTAQLIHLAGRRGVPAVFFAWQNLDKRLPPPFGWLRSWVFRRAAGAIAGTARAGEVLRARGYEGPLAVIPQFGVDPDRFAPDPEARCDVRRALDIAPDAFVVGFAGRLVSEKGVGLLLAATGRLAGAHLLVLGEGPERKRLESEARRMGIADRVHLVGHRPSLEIPRWLAACDVVALPSVGRRGWTEQFGRILVEAMACRVPVVGTRTGEIPAVVADGGLVVDAGQPEALARALRELAADPAWRSELGRRGRARVLAHYTHENVAARTAVFYREVLS